MSADDRRRVLAVDDDRQILSLIELALGEEHIVYPTTRGAAGLQFLEAHAFDLVILDLAMPGMGGDEFKRTMDARGLRTPVLLLSGEVDLPQRAAQLGADGFLHKPFDMASLTAHVAALLGSSGR